MSDVEYQHYPIDLDGIPKTWCVTSIASLGADVQSGFPTGDHNRDGRGIPHIRPMNIDRNGNIDLNDIKYVSPATSVLRLQKGDVLFNNTNSPELIGKTAAITHCDEWAFSNHMTRLRFPIESVEYRFAAHQLHYLWIARYFRHRCVNHVNQASISGKPLSQTVPFLIAPLGEQRRIVAKIEELFSDLDSGVALLERAKANLKRYRAAVLKAAVEGKLTEEWRAKHPAKEPASALLARILKERREKWEADQLAKFAAAGKEPPKNWREKYVEPLPPDTSNLPELPDGWCWASVEQLMVNSPQNGAYFPKTQYGNGIPIIRIDDYQQFWSRSANEAQRVEVPQHAKELYGLAENDILVNRVNSMTHLGKVLQVEARHLPSIFESNLMRLRFVEKRTVPYVRDYLRSHSGISRLRAEAKWAVNQASINQQDVQRTSVPFPPLVEQQHIVTEVAERLSQIDAAEMQIEHGLLRATRLRQSILKQAFEGKLFPQDPSDEPASVLLERLRAQQSIKGENRKAGNSIRTFGRGAKSKKIERRVAE